MTTTIERLPGERPRAYQALLDYVKMPRRSLAELAAGYKRVRSESKESLVPTVRQATLHKWSSLYHWQARVIAFDIQQEQERLEKWQRRREELAEMDWVFPVKVRRVLETLIAASADAREHAAYATAYVKYDELMRLAADEPTKITRLTGDALAAFLGSMEKLINAGAAETGGEPDDGDAADDDTPETTD